MSGKSLLKISSGKKSTSLGAGGGENKGSYLYFSIGAWNTELVSEKRL